MGEGWKLLDSRISSSGCSTIVFPSESLNTRRAPSLFPSLSVGHLITDDHTKMGNFKRKKEFIQILITDLIMMGLVPPRFSNYNNNKTGPGMTCAKIGKR